MPLMDRREEKRPWGLIVGLTVAATAGLLSLPLQVLTFRSLDAASKEDIQQNQRLVQQVKTIEEQNGANVDQHRIANQADHDCIVSLALMLADPKRDRSVTPVLPAPCVDAPAAK